MEPSSVETIRGQYSIMELLHLRETLPAVKCVVSNINRHPDIGGIFRLPIEALEDADNFICKTKSLPVISGKPTFPSKMRRPTDQTTEESEIRNRREWSMDRDTQHVRWNFRRRDDSERSSQPYSAPSDIGGQMSENFQRFYRAVVSPAHVRVTAGGRIVPNTRTLTTPAFQWNGDKQQFESHHKSRESVVNHEASNWHATNTDPMMLPPNGVPLPFHRAPPHNFMLPFPPPQMLSIHGAGEQRHLGMNHQLSVPTESEPGPAPVKISPATQFDHGKPFVLNGQLLYPMSQRQQPPVGTVPIPYAMVGSTPVLGHSPTPPFTGFFPPHMAVPATSMLPSFILPNQPMPMPIGGLAQLPVQPMPFKPRVGLISISELTKNQLQELRSLLRTIDYELTHNKHQVKEDVMLSQRAAVDAQIATMETMLKMQLMAESNQNLTYPDVAGTSFVDSQQQTNPLGANSSFTSTIASSGSTSTSDGQKDVTGIYPNNQSRHTKIYINGIESQKAAGVSPVKSRISSHPVSKLPAAAVMAPPFQPRAKVEQNSMSNIGSSQEEVVSPSYMDMQAVTSKNDEGTTGSRSFPGHHSTEQAPTILDNTIHSSLPKSDSFPGNTTALQAMQAQSIPYLVGTLPAGLRASDATPYDLIYSRELTEEEVQARVMYWGRAPHHARVGLPKFDGKDFYPPSPIKRSAKPATPHKGNDNANILPDFSNLFDDDAYPGWKVDSPARSVVAGKSLRAELEMHPSMTCPPVQALNLRKSDSCSSRLQTPTHLKNNSQKVGVDLSNLFLEPGAPVSPSSSQPAPGPFFLDSSTSLRRGLISTNQAGDHSGTSTIEIRLSPQRSSEPAYKSTDNSPSVNRPLHAAEKSTLFLQNFLKNNVAMSSPALLGGITTATAQGHLPLYRGSAAASLSPTMLSMATFERSKDQMNPKMEQPRVVNGSTFNFKNSVNLPENRPLSRAIPIVHPSVAYASAHRGHLSQRMEDNEHSTEQDWNVNTSGTGPITGSNW